MINFRRRRAGCVRLSRREGAVDRAQVQVSGVAFEEADEATDWLRYFVTRVCVTIRHWFEKEKELAGIFAASVATARKNSRRWKDHPNSG